MFLLFLLQILPCLEKYIFYLREEENTSHRNVNPCSCFVQEFFVKNADRVELMAMLGLFGAIVSAIQMYPQYIYKIFEDVCPHVISHLINDNVCINKFV